MSNYINVRIQSTSNSKIKNRIKHNIRYVKSLNNISDEPNFLAFLEKAYNTYKLKICQKSTKIN